MQVKNLILRFEGPQKKKFSVVYLHFLEINFVHGECLLSEIIHRGGSSWAGAKHWFCFLETQALGSASVRTSPPGRGGGLQHPGCSRLAGGQVHCPGARAGRRAGAGCGRPGGLAILEGAVRETKAAGAAAPQILLPGLRHWSCQQLRSAPSAGGERQVAPLPGSALAAVMAGRGSDLARGPSAFPCPATRSRVAALPENLVMG